MAVRLLSQSVAAALALPLVWLPRASADSNQLKAVVFEDVKPLYQKTDSGYEGLGVEILEQIRTQASRGQIHYRVAKSVKDGLNAVITGQVDIACGVAFTWGRSSQLSYTLPFGLGGTRLLTTTTTVDGTASSLNEETVGVVKDSASNKILKSVVPGVTLKVFDTPGQALAAFNTGAVQTLAGHPSGWPQTAILTKGFYCPYVLPTVLAVLASAASSIKTMASCFPMPTGPLAR